MTAEKCFTGLDLQNPATVSVPMFRALTWSCLSFFVLSPLVGQNFTLEQVMSAPFSTNLIAAPKGSSFLWVADQQGRRNIWVADAGPGAAPAHRVTAYMADEGLEIDNVTWTPDGESIVYVRGGDFEHPRSGAPNPR